MELLDFCAEELYFDEPLQPEVERLLNAAADGYAQGTSELPLFQAYFLQPEHLSVLVALYRFYFYQGRRTDALRVVTRVLQLVAGRLGMTADWRAIEVDDLGRGAQRSMALLRFYLFALKAAGYLELRLGRTQAALQRFEKVLELDTADRIGTAALADLARTSLRKDGAPARQAAGRSTQERHATIEGEEYV